MRREVEDVVELMQHIQSRLPITEAARTSVLSKSWLHAWHTIPILRFCVRSEQNGNGMKLVDVDHTLIRYLRDNIPIERFELLIDIENQESASHAEKWIGPVVTTKASCLKELSLSLFLYGAPFTLPDEILSSGENLSKIDVSSPLRHHSVIWMTTTTPTPVINCVSLRELQLDGVCIGEEALHDILSSCSRLEKIVLIHSCKGFKTIKVKNLPCLYELTISSSSQDVHNTALEISHVPNLGVFTCDLPFLFKAPAPHSISLGSSVTELTLGGYGMVTGNACLKMIESGFPFLESLTLDDMRSWKSESFHFTCASIKNLTLRDCQSMLTDIQVHAPKLNFFWFGGAALPTLLFPVSSTLFKQIFSLSLSLPVDVYFFLKMREALALSCKCDIYIITYNYTTTMLPFDDIDMDDLRTRLLLFPPAMNVQHLWFGTVDDECLWERSLFFDAFFEICHPKYVYAKPDSYFRQNNHFCRLMLREVLEKNTTPYWPHYLEHVRIRRDRYQKWETLTNSHTSLLASSVYMIFNLKWR
ncbi:putative F-box/LRR-repeat protein At5g02700 [Lactuca sativa]|nr:putative F-box/LRR-repeat protein At5g02700 [Lactuca sativa]